MFFDEILIVRLSYSLSSVITLENSFHREMFLSFASNIKRGVNNGWNDKEEDQGEDDKFPERKYHALQQFGEANVETRLRTNHSDCCHQEYCLTCPKKQQNEILI